MVIEQTQQQSIEEQQRAQALSLKRERPPIDVPGYEPSRFLGAGAFGEVWVAVDRTTGRQVAIKFYAHRGGLDWSILTREVEKLAFLAADRYVVQLLDVGWESDPPYYVMEYVEQGSLEDLLRRERRLGVPEAVTLFRDIAVGLLHAHAKGVLHCDLKPANILFDQDRKPRVADFGQSRLSHEQTPALGTLFYMAPEQADLKALPDVGWDVYALGALLYCMLTGAPPHRGQETVTEIETAANLDERLTRYREIIERSPPPALHRQVPGIDRALAEIVDGCLAKDRKKRFANVQAVLDALELRERRRAKRPLLFLGAVGPALVVAVLALLAWQWFDTVMNQSDEALRARALQSNHFAAQYVAKTVTNELEVLYRAVEEMAASPRFQSLLQRTVDDPQVRELRQQLSDPALPPSEQAALRGRLQATAAQQELQHRLDELLKDEEEPRGASWFVTDSAGLQLARAPLADTVGRNFAWRTYFHGGDADYSPDWRAKPDEHITKTHLSSVLRSLATNRWVVTISTPVAMDLPRTAAGKSGAEPRTRFLGVIAMTVDVGRFVELKEGDRQFAVLVDWRNGPNKGIILQHPLYEKLVENHGRLPPDRMHKYRLNAEDLPRQSTRERYVDPMGSDPEGEDFDRRWLAEYAPVGIRDGNTGWIVIVEESYQGAIGRILSRLRSSLLTTGFFALVAITVVSTALWGFVIRVLVDPPAATIPADVDTTAVPEIEV